MSRSTLSFQRVPRQVDSSEQFKSSGGGAVMGGEWLWDNLYNDYELKISSALLDNKTNGMKICVIDDPCRNKIAILFGVTVKV